MDKVKDLYVELGDALAVLEGRLNAYKWTVVGLDFAVQGVYTSHPAHVLEMLHPEYWLEFVKVTDTHYKVMARPVFTSSDRGEVLYHAYIA